MPRAFKLKAPEPSEEETHVALARLMHMLVLPPAEWTCFPAGNIPLPPQAAAKLARMGLRRGWPDFIIVHAGNVFGLELKRHGMQLSKTRITHTRNGSPRILVGQQDTFPRLREAGMYIGIAYGVDQAMRMLKEWDIPMRAVIHAELD